MKLYKMYLLDVNRVPVTGWEDGVLYTEEQIKNDSRLYADNNDDYKYYVQEIELKMIDDTGKFIDELPTNKETE